MTPDSSSSSSSSDSTDVELVLGVRRGDRRAFVEIVARHQAMVCGIALGILGEFAASEDVGQEAFLNAWNRFGDLRDPENLRAWLGQIARNTALGHLRRRKVTEPLDPDGNHPDTAPGPDVVAASQEEAALVRDALARLPEAYRIPLVLFYREGHSVRAVAEALAISEVTARQRLSRGRELLRERMSGLVESVLTRTGPTAVFTVAVAVSIGALAAPASVAGAVFTSAATTSATGAATSVAGSSSATLVSAMSSTKSLLAVAAVLAAVCVPLGYQAAKLGEIPSATTGSEAPRNSTGRTFPARPSVQPSFADSELFAEWRALHEIHGTSPESMPVLFKVIGELQDPFRRRAFRAALIAEWAELDPRGGLIHFIRHPDAALRRQYLEEWLSRDPQGLVDGLLASGPGWEPTARALLPEVARHVPGRLGELVGRLPVSGDFWDTSIRDAFAVVAERDLAAARKGALEIPAVHRLQAVSGVAMVSGRSDLGGILSWINTLPDGLDRDEVFRAALVGRASSNPVDALERVGEVSPGGREGTFATSTGARVLREASRVDFDATVAWLAAHPGKLGGGDLLGMAEAVTDRMNADVRGFLSQLSAHGSLGPLMEAIESALLNAAAGQRAAVWDWLNSEPESDATRALRQKVLLTAGFQDPKLALKLAADLPSSPESEPMRAQLAQALLNGGRELGRFESMYRQAPELLRPPLLEAGFDFLNSGNLADPSAWVAHLGELPEANREKGIVTLTRAWAGQSPEEAKDWVERLPTGEARRQALEELATAWIRFDAPSAAAWIGTLPQGSERDRAAYRLVSNLGDSSHAVAWQWALSISDEALRGQAATHVIQKVASRDPGRALHWIKTGPFSTEFRESLESLAGLNSTAPNP